MSGSALMHKGSELVDREVLQGMILPEQTNTYFPVKHTDLLDQVIIETENAGLRVENTQLYAKPNGSQFFGLLNLSDPNGYEGESCPTVGIRNSYDKSMAAGLVAGNRVFICDNLSFTGEVAFRRTHSRFIHRDLPMLISGALKSVNHIHQIWERRFNELKTRPLTRKESDHLIMEAFRSDVVPSSKLAKVHTAYEEPEFAEFKQHNAWALYNAFTSVFKEFKNPVMKSDRGIKLSKLFVRKFDLV